MEDYRPTVTWFTGLLKRDDATTAYSAFQLLECLEDWEERGVITNVDMYCDEPDEQLKVTFMASHGQVQVTLAPNAELRVQKYITSSLKGMTFDELQAMVERRDDI